MKPIKFPQVTVELQKPGSMTDEQCGPLPVWRGEIDGVPASISCFHIDDAELAKITADRRVWLYMYADRHPPVALGVDDPWEEKCAS